MARYILIDNGSGFIFGDTADLPRCVVDGEELTASNVTPTTAALWLDQTVVKADGRFYEEVPQLASNETGYLVYRADSHGMNRVPPIENGQSQAEINAVTNRCQLVALVRCSGAE